VFTFSMSVRTSVAMRVVSELMGRPLPAVSPTRRNALENEDSDPWAANSSRPDPPPRSKKTRRRAYSPGSGTLKTASVSAGPRSLGKDVVNT
jgi:hypothetical protein